MIDTQSKQSNHLNKSATDLQPLHSNQLVYVQTNPEKMWKPAKLLQITTCFQLGSQSLQTVDGPQLHCNP